MHIHVFLWLTALGVKEVWQVPDHIFRKGYIQHTLGWPLQSSPFTAETFGGSFLYHQEPNVRERRFELE
jgi:electron-transferring-flavoprotein dehydrogenase